MRFIDLDDLELPDGWEDKAKKKTDELKECSTPKGRKDLINKDSSQKIWKDLKSALAKLSHDKCWYSEAKDIMSERDVDHFRPKKESVDYDGTKYEGYWWLTFDYRNYRFSSQYSNQLRNNKEGKSRGKGTHFPLKKGSFRATNFTDDCRSEEPVLLDPTVLSDTLLLSFSDTGAAIPNPTYDEESWEYQRATESIRKYHLDFHLIVQAREIIWKEVQRLITQTDNWIKDDITGPMVKKDIEENMKRLRTMTKPKAILSATAIAAMQSSSVDWARKLAVA